MEIIYPNERNSDLMNKYREILSQSQSFHSSLSEKGLGSYSSREVESVNSNLT